MRYPYDWRVSAAMWRIEEMWTRTVGQFAPGLKRLHTFLQPECWVRSRSPIHRGGDERASERGRACALATPVFAPPCTEDITVRATVTRNAQQELPGSWLGRVNGELLFVTPRRSDACVAGRVATAGGKAAQAVNAGVGLREAQSGPCRSKVDSRNASLPCVGLIGWNR